MVLIQTMKNGGRPKLLYCDILLYIKCVIINVMSKVLQLNLLLQECTISYLKLMSKSTINQKSKTLKY